MKLILISVFLIFCSSKALSQKLKDPYECEKLEKKDSLLYSQLLKESKRVNYDKLAEKIIADLDKNEFSQPNLVVYIEDYYEAKKPIFYMEPCDCCFKRLAENPVYNDHLFLTQKNIKKIVEKFRINVIPRNATFGYFFYQKASEAENSKLRKIYKKTKKQKSGLYKDSSPNNHHFYYFPFNDKENLILVDQYPELNFNTLQLYFRNELGNKVSLNYRYDVDNIYKKSVSKLYQYKDGKWNDITLQK
jgi:hypothetical protein